MPKPRGDVEIKAYYIKLFQQESCQNLKMAAIGRNM